MATWSIDSFMQYRAFIKVSDLSGQYYILVSAGPHNVYNLYIGM